MDILELKKALLTATDKTRNTVVFYLDKKDYEIIIESEEYEYLEDKNLRYFFKYGPVFKFGDDIYINHLQVSYIFRLKVDKKDVQDEVDDMVSKIIECCNDDIDVDCRIPLKDLVKGIAMGIKEGINLKL